MHLDVSVFKDGKDYRLTVRTEEFPFERLPNAQVQGRPLGVAEACAGGGVPCNAQLGA